MSPPPLELVIRLSPDRPARLVAAGDRSMLARWLREDAEARVLVASALALSKAQRAEWFAQLQTSTESAGGEA